MLLITCGSIFKGNLKMLKRDKDTKAFSASKILFSSTVTYTANVVKATCRDMKQTEYRSFIIVVKHLIDFIGQLCLSKG